MKTALVPTLLLCLACGSGGGTAASSDVASPSNHYKIGRNENHVIAYDARARGAYLAADEKGKLRYCAEPSPDAVADLSSRLERELSGGATVGLSGTPVTVGATASTAETAEAASVVASVAQRTETLLLCREAMYRLCELHLNGVYDQKETQEQFERILSSAQLLGQGGRSTESGEIFLDWKARMKAQSRLFLGRRVCLSGLHDRQEHA